jgi:hypothetical protein
VSSFPAGAGAKIAAILSNARAMALPDSVRKTLGPLLTLLLVAGIGVAIWLSSREQAVLDQAAAVIEVKGLSGSEKLPYLSDPRVLKRLEQLGLRLNVQKAGSRQIALRPDLKQFDFAYPAGVPAATKLQREQGIREVFPTFFTPMVVASWKPVVAVLEANGIARKRDNAWYIIDMEKLLAWMNEGRRWRDIPGNTQYPVGKSVLISSTDVRDSNSAAMYLALASYLANGRDVVQSDAQLAAVLPRVAPLFLKQGYQESSSAGPFEDYLSMGMGKAPLVMAYESQFIEHLAATPVSARNPEMVLLYPEPTVYTKHVLVPLNDKGRRLGQALANDPELQRLAVEFGFRVNNPSQFRDVNMKRGIQAPDSLLDVVDPPTYELLEKMIVSIGASPTE